MTIPQALKLVLCVRTLGERGEVFVLDMGGRLGARALRRVLYEMDHRYQRLPESRRRRILILGAGLSGVGIALEIGRYPHLQVVGFVDDDARQQGCLIGGHRVLGSSERLRDLMRQNQVSDLIVCAQSMPPERLGDVREACAACG